MMKEIPELPPEIEILIDRVTGKQIWHKRKTGRGVANLDALDYKTLIPYKQRAQLGKGTNWRPDQPPQTIAIRCNVARNSDSPIRNPDKPKTARHGFYQSRIDRKWYPLYDPTKER